MRTGAISLVVITIVAACGATSAPTVTPAPSQAVVEQPSVAPSTAPARSTPTPAPRVQWTRTAGFPVGGIVGAVAVEPGEPDRVYAGIEDVGFMMTKDRGRTWTRHDPGHHFPRGILLDPLDKRLAYYLYGGGVATIDRTSGSILRGAGLGRGPGYTLDNSVKAIAADVTGRRLYATSPAGVFRSTDQGATFRPIGTGLPSGTVFSALGVHPSDERVVYVGTRGPWYYDSLMPDQPPPATGKGLFRSVDTGETWQRVGAQAMSASLHINAIAIDPRDARNVYVGTADGVFRSNDAGTSWSAANSGLRDRAVWTLAIDPRDPRRIFAGTWGGGLFVTTDGADSWSATGFNGIDFQRDRVFSLAFDPTTEDLLYVGTGDGLFRYDMRSRSHGAVGGTVFRSAAADLAVTPAEPRTLYVLEGGSGGGRDLLRSRDDGQSWEFIGPVRPLQSTSGGAGNRCLFGLDCPPYSVDHRYGMVVTIDPRDAGTVWFSSAYGLFRTRDGGESWERIRFNGVLPDNFHYHGVAIHPKQPDVMYVSTGGAVASREIFTHVVKSTDGGRTWALVENGLPRANFHMDVAVHPEDPNVAYLFGTTTGFGCQPSHPPDPPCVAVGVYKTADGGGSWAPVNDGLADLDVLALAFHPRDRAIVYVAAGPSVYISRNAGATWSRLLTLTQRDLRPSSIAIDPRDPGLIIVGVRGAPQSGGGVHISLDAGTSWEPANDGLSDGGRAAASIEDVVIDARTNTVYATGGGVYKAKVPSR